MRLRIRTLAIVGLLMAVLLTALYVTARTVILSDFRRLEQSTAEADAVRLENALFDDIRQLERVATDWAPRNDTYDFMRGLNPGYANNLLTDETLASLGVNAVMFVREDGSIAYVTGVDLDLGVRVPLDTSLQDTLAAADYLRAPGDPHAHISGVIRVPGGVMLVAARAVTSSDMYSPPAGTLILGRRLDAVEVERLAAITGLAVTALPLDGQNLTSGQARSIEVVDADRLTTRSRINDVQGKPVLVLRADLPRDVYARGLGAVKYLAFALLVLGAAAALTVLGIIDKTVLHRLHDLSDELTILGERHDPSQRVTVKGNDELGDLARDINTTLAAIQDSEEELKRARDELESRVIERTAELASSEERYRELIESMADALFTCDLMGHITLANEAAGTYLGMEPEEMVGLPFLRFMAGSSLPAVSQYLDGTSHDRWPWTVEAQLYGTAHDPISVEMTVAPLFDGDGERSGTQWIVRDIAERKRYEQRLIHLASHDHLTGLSNRRQFEDSLEIELARARRSDACGALVWLDLDDFKDVNDSFGHRVGDEVLVSVSEVLRHTVRESNLLARMGGDEFAVLMPGVTADEAEVAGARLLSAINGHSFTVEGNMIRLSASVGLVIYPEHGSTTAELLSNADIAMYDAKSTGRARLITATPGERRKDEMRSRLMWNDRLVNALDDDRFCAFAQPIVDVRTGRLHCLELLLRMIDEEGEIVGPMDFLPSAERLGLIRDIDLWMMRHAVAVLAGCPDESFRLEVNLSGQSFADSDYVIALSDTLRDSGVDPGRLGVEITETAAITDIARAREFISAVAEIGCHSALDDFGSGFSSFYYLRNMPVDCLKIDGSFIRELPSSHQDRHLVRAIVELCRGLEIQIAAEYVESAEILAEVDKLGIDFAQGYHLGRPEPLADALARLRETPIIAGT